MSDFMYVPNATWSFILVCQTKLETFIVCFFSSLASGLYMLVFWSIVWKSTIVMNSKANIFQELKSYTCWIGRWVMPDIQSRRVSVCSVKGLDCPHSLIQGAKPSIPWPLRVFWDYSLVSEWAQRLCLQKGKSPWVRSAWCYLLVV